MRSCVFLRKKIRIKATKKKQNKMIKRGREVIQKREKKKENRLLFDPRDELSFSQKICFNVILKQEIRKEKKMRKREREKRERGRKERPQQRSSKGWE